MTTTTGDWYWNEYRPTFTSTAIIPESRSLSVQALVGDNAAVAHVKYLGFVYSGSSKRHPGDRKDATIAYDLAVGRALANLAKRLIDDANKRSMKGDH